MKIKNKITKKNVEYMEVWSEIEKIANIEIHRKSEDIVFYVKGNDVLKKLSVEEKNDSLLQYIEWFEKQSFSVFCFVLDVQEEITKEWKQFLGEKFEEQRLWVSSPLKTVERKLQGKGTGRTFLYKEEQKGKCNLEQLQSWTEEIIQELQNDNILVGGRWTKAGNFLFHFEDSGAQQMFPIFYQEKCEMLYGEERIGMETFEKETVKIMIQNLLDKIEKKTRLQKLLHKTEQKHFFHELTISPLNEKGIVREALLTKMTERELEVLSMKAKMNKEVFIIAKEGRFNSIRMFGYKIAFDVNGFVIAEQDEEFFEKLRGLLIQQNEQTIQKLQKKWEEKDEAK